MTEQRKKLRSEPIKSRKAKAGVKLDVLLGVIVGINKNRGCSIRQIASRLYWVPKKKLVALLDMAVERGLLEESKEGQYKVRWDDEEDEIPRKAKPGVPTEGCKCYACEHWRTIEREESDQNNKEELNRNISPSAFLNMSYLRGFLNIWTCQFWCQRVDEDPLVAMSHNEHKEQDKRIQPKIIEKIHIK